MIKNESRQVKNVEHRDGIKIKGRRDQDVCVLPDQDVCVLPAYKPVSFSKNRSAALGRCGESRRSNTPTVTSSFS